MRIIVLLLMVILTASCGPHDYQNFPEPKSGVKDSSAQPEKPSSKSSYSVRHSVSNKNTGLLIKMKSQDFSKSDSLDKAKPDPQVLEKNSSLIQSLKTIKIDQVFDDETNEFSFSGKIKIQSFGEEPKFVEFLDWTPVQLSSDEKNIWKYTSSDTAGEYSLSVSCVDELCNVASMSLLDKKTNFIANIDYIKTTEYLKSNTMEVMNLSDDERQLLRDTMEYHLPIERHSARLETGRVVDLLVLTTPEVEESIEDFTRDDDEASQMVADDSGSQIDSVGVLLELETESESPSIQESEPATVPTESEAPPPSAATEQATSNQGGVSSLNGKILKSIAQARAELEITQDPFEVYDIKFPDRFFKLGQSVGGDPVKITSNLPLVEIADQQPFEPAFRIAVIAEHFVKEKVRVFKNSCSHFVRAVMSLAGYKSGGYSNANGFERLFSVRAHGLNQWNQKRFLYNAKSLPKVHSSLDAYLKGLPEYHGIIYQIDRARIQRPKGVKRFSNGHVAILTRIDGKLIIFDTELNRKPPKRTEVTPAKLVTRTRWDTNNISLPGLIE